MRSRTLIIAACCLSLIPAYAREVSVFYPEDLMTRARANMDRFPWAVTVRDEVVAKAQPWLKHSDDELWNLMFGATITRSWMVWSNGHCPGCKEGVPMYNWGADPFGHPWKMQCPHCQESFPKNDFAKFYQSGLDSHGVFDPKLADRSLLYNTEHPDPADPLHGFGVDDGNGYVEGEKRWRFIGTYLVYGQWKRAVVGGITALADAYMLTGDRVYAHRAAVLLDRVADLYPTFDFKTQAAMYEGPAHAGYVSTWHDACEEVREMALAYDQVRGGLEGDEALVTFLAGKARQYGLENPKATEADIHRNIRDRILQDTITNAWKIQSNYPRQIVALIVIKAVLGWPGNREEIMGMMDPMIQQATAVDGVTGEKGLAGYTCYTIAGLAEFLAFWDRAQPGFLEDLVKRHPRLRDMARFHIDTWASAGGDPVRRYYPQSGDTGNFAILEPVYRGMNLPSRAPGSKDNLARGIEPSMLTFLIRLTEVTGDPAFAQAVYIANGQTVADLPHDLFVKDPAAVQEQVAAVIAQAGPEPLPGTLNKQQWRLAMLRSGQGATARTAWLDYDAGGGHAHFDAMNLGLFAKGLDLMPDLGYPPVQYGGWSGAKFAWYVITASHNTVVVNGNSQAAGAGTTTLWGEGQGVRLIRAAAPQLAACRQYERTIAMVDVGEADSYLIDLFRVVGGSDHAKFMHSHFGTVSTPGLTAQPGEEYGHGAQMRNYQRVFEADGVTPAKPGWVVDWDIEDRGKLLPEGSDVHLRYTDLTTDAEAYTAEGWVSLRGYSGNEEAWVPRVMVRRRAAAEPLASTFVGVIEPYESRPLLAAIRRLPVVTTKGENFPDAYVALEIARAAGGSDLFLAADAGDRSAFRGRVMSAGDWGLKTDAEAVLVRRDAAGAVTSLALWGGKRADVGGVTLRLNGRAGFAQIAVSDGKARLVAGDEGAVAELRP